MGVACMGGADACTARPSTSTSVSAEMRDNKKPTNNSKKSKEKTGECNVFYAYVFTDFCSYLIR